MVGAKSQSWKNRGKITIDVPNRGTNTNLPNKFGLWEVGCFKVILAFLHRRLGTALSSPLLSHSHPTETSLCLLWLWRNGCDNEPLWCATRGAPAAMQTSGRLEAHVGPGYYGLTRHEIGMWAHAWAVAAACGLPRHSTSWHSAGPEPAQWQPGHGEPMLAGPGSPNGHLYHKTVGTNHTSYTQVSS
jgi:hypothetical protein